MKKTGKRLSLATALIMLLCLAACSAGGKSSEAPVSDMAEYDAPPGGEYESYEYSSSATSPSEPQARTEDGFLSGAAMSGEDVELMTDPALSAISPEKIIYSGEAEIETLEFDETLEKLAAMIEDCGGFLQSSSITGRDYYSTASGMAGGRRAYYQMRIPSDKFFDLTGQLESLGNVPYSSTQADNISAQYRDAEARLLACRTQETRYLELLEKAETVEEVLYVESYLSDVRYQIESLESQIRGWNSQVSYSTLSLTITEVAVYTDEPVDIDAPSYGEQLSSAFNKTMKSLGRFFKGFFKFLVGAAPVLVLLAVITVPVILIVRAKHRKNAAKKTEQGYPKNPE